jgi:ABC-type nitrate/sulfonate/bicarbonate transport system substrate-binding protein
MLLSACTPATETQTEAEANADDVGHRTITVARTPNFSDSTVAIAQQAGWFDDAGLEVTIVDGRGTTDVVPMLLSGEVDVVYGGFAAWNRSVYPHVPASRSSSAIERDALALKKGSSAVPDAMVPQLLGGR